MRHWEGNYDGLMDFWDDTSPETTAFALKLLIRQDRSSGLMPKAARWLAEHRDGDYWYSTKQTSMVIQGLTDYLARAGGREPAGAHLQIGVAQSAVPPHNAFPVGQGLDQRVEGFGQVELDGL